MNFLNIVLQTNLSQTVTHPSADELVKHDPYGVYMALMSIALVMIILSLIYLFFKTITRIINKPAKPKNINAEQKAGIKETISDNPSGEVGAAIAYALHLYAKQSDEEENTVITIKKMAHRYSPWSSKIYTLQRLPGQGV